MQKTHFLALSQVAKIDEFYFVPIYQTVQNSVSFAHLHTARKSDTPTLPKGNNIMSPALRIFPRSEQMQYAHLDIVRSCFMRSRFLWVVFACLLIVAAPIKAQQQGLLTIFGDITLPSTASTLVGTLGGVQLTLTDNTGSTVSVTASSGGGGFLFTNVTSGVFTITPSRAGSTFFPSSTTITVTSQTIRLPTFTMLPELPVISGRIVLLQDVNIPFTFANITITNPSRPNVILRPRVLNDGTFSVAVSTTGTYTIQPEASRLREGFVITPNETISNTNASTTVFVGASGELSNNRFTLVATIPTYRLSGGVRFDYEPSAANIDITQLSPTGASLSTISTLATVTGEPYSVMVTNATYRITSRLTTSQASFYTGTPTQYSVNVRSNNIDGLNFSYAPRLVTVSGKIIRVVGNARLPVANLPVRLMQFNTSLQFDSATTSTDGSYSLNVRALDNTLPLLVVLPPPTEYTFRYQNRDLPIQENVVRGSLAAVLDIGEIRANTVVDDIIATPIPPRQYTITGRVLYRTSNAPVRETLTLIVTNATNSLFRITERRRITLDDDGNYFINVTAGNYELSFLADRHIISPAIRIFDVPRDSEGFRLNFQATLQSMLVTGVVQTIIGLPITGATIRLGSGGVDGLTTTTDERGFYRIAVPDQFPENRFNVVPSTGGTTFFPPSRLVVVNVASPTLINMDFRATSTTNTLPLSSISGRITIRENGQERGQAGVTISDGTRNIISGTDGRYILPNVPNGTYTLTASLDNYAFTPPSLTVSVISGTRPQNQNFIARFLPVTANRAPVLQVQPNDIPVIAASTTRVPIATLFADPDLDPLTISTFVEDPTLLRTRRDDGILLIDALSEGNTMVNITANDNRGGSVTASFRVTVNRPVVAPRFFTRPKGNVNTNYNAALIIEAQTFAAIANIPPDKNTSSVNAGGGELGAFNSNCDCVGSIVWTGANAVLPVWAEDKANGIPGMRLNEPINIRYFDEIKRSSRRGRVLYLQGGGTTPRLWPIDQAIISSLELNDDPCIPVISSVFTSLSVQNANDMLKANIQPNPAASRALLRYTLPASGKVVIELWNTLGQKISRLFEGTQGEGEQRLDVDVDSLPTGMYLCRVRREGTAASDVSTVRISVIR